MAQVLGDELLQQTVVVGGLVPTLLYAGVAPSPETGAHVGTTDLDLTLDVAILEEARYEEIAARFSRAGFVPDKKENGNIVRQRWTRPEGAKIDFLMPPVAPDTKGGSLQSLTSELAAFTMLGLDLALGHSITCELSSDDLEGSKVTRRIPVCAPHIYVILKGLAIARRAKNKDAYDLYYVLKHDGARPRALGNKLAAVASHDAVVQGIASIERDFHGIDARGPRDVGRFLGELGDELAADVYAHAVEFLEGFRAVT
jgi:hypothetical protein